MVIPLYAYPGAVWQSIINYHQQYPSVPIMVVINPSNGPGWYSSTFASWISTMQSKGIKVLGYVATGYTSVPLSTVETYINDYSSWYKVNGVFLDQMENVPGYEWYYSSATNYAYGIGVSFVLGNPGTSVTPSYIRTTTNIGIYENSGCPSVSLIQSYNMGYPASNFSFICYYAGPLPSQSYFTSMAHYVSWVFVTDQSAAWASLPSYMGQELAELAAA